MTNRINGDFDRETIEAFRAAYANQILSPEDQEVDDRTGLPTNLVLNTSPWIQHTGLWKANDGTDKNFVPNQVLVPGEGDQEELSEEEINSLLDEVVSEMDGSSDEEELTEEELESLLEEILDGIEAEEIEETLERIRSGDWFEEDYLDEGAEDTGEEGGEETENAEDLSDEDIDAIIAELEAELESD